MTQLNKKNWDKVITPTSGNSLKSLKEVFQYKELFYRFIKRDFSVFYKQTILGPLWYIIQPLIYTVLFTVIFGNFAKIPTDGLPPFIFYLSGNIIWSYFSFCLSQVSNTFSSNAGIFSKIYFPRLIIPLTVITNGLFQFIIQFIIYLGFYYYFILSGSSLNGNSISLFLPVLLVYVAVLALGVGLIISSLVTKYKDLTLAMGLLIQIWLFISPVIYPLSQVPENFRNIYCLNPMVSIIEIFRQGFLGESSINLFQISLGLAITLILLILGLVSFNKTERNFIDTI